MYVVLLTTLTGSATVPITDATTIQSFTSATSAPTSTIPSTIATSSAIRSASATSSSASDSSSSKSTDHTPAIIAGVIGTIAAILVLGLLAWVRPLTSFCYQRKVINAGVATDSKPNSAEFGD